jgi:streptogramin lyase
MKTLIATLAGLLLLLSIPASASDPFNNPNGIVFDSSGNLWLANAGDNNVLELSINASKCTFNILNTITNGISNPTRLAFDSQGNLWVTNWGQNNVTVYDNLSSQGASLIATISNSAFNHPLGIAVDDYGDFYVANNSNNDVVALTAGDQLVETLFQDNSAFPFLAPGVLVIHEQNIYAGFGPCSFSPKGAGSCEDAVISYNVGEFLTTNPAEVTVYKDANQTGPTGVAFDSKNDVYVSYYTTPSWVKYKANGKSPQEFQDGVNGPEGIALDSSDNVYVSNSAANDITVYSPSGGLSCTLN